MTLNDRFVLGVVVVLLMLALTIAEAVRMGVAP
jgi:hypothetical protein